VNLYFESADLPVFGAVRQKNGFEKVKLAHRNLNISESKIQIEMPGSEVRVEPAQGNMRNLKTLLCLSGIVGQ
jgi:hypothetical protein